MIVLLKVVFLLLSTNHSLGDMAIPVVTAPTPLIHPEELTWPNLLLPT